MWVTGGFCVNVGPLSRSRKEEYGRVPGIFKHLATSNVWIECLDCVVSGFTREHSFSSSIKTM
jgi:hypothetical protein